MDYNQDIFFKMQQQQMPGKQPFYMTNPIQNLYMTELEYQRDLDRMKEMYPQEVRKIQDLVEEECDKMEYEGSLMFDEYPDRLMLRQICKRIRDKAGLSENRETMDVPMERRVENPGERRMESPAERMPEGQLEGQNVRGSGCGRNGCGNDLVEVLLFHEMFHRRCRYRRCRRWW